MLIMVNKLIIRYCCGKQCELLLNRFLIRDLHHKLDLLSFTSFFYNYDKIRPPPLFQPRVEKNFDPPPRLSTPHLKKNFDPPPPPFGQFEHCLYYLNFSIQWSYFSSYWRL